MNRPPVLRAFLLVLLVCHHAFAARESWVPGAIRQIVASNPDVWVCKTDGDPEGRLEQLGSFQENRAEFRSLIDTRLKTTVPVSADEKKKLFTILLEPANYIDPTERLNIIANPPNLECIFKSPAGTSMMSVGDWCFTLYSEGGAEGWHIFSHKGTAAFAHWQHVVQAKATDDYTAAPSQPQAQSSLHKVQYVTLKGDNLRASGLLEWTPGLTLTEAIAGGGGTSGNPNVYLIRGKERIRVRLTPIDRNLAPDPILQPGDVVEVDNGTF